MGHVLLQPRTSATGSLQVGQTLPYALCDAHGELLLPPGQEVTKSLIDWLNLSQVHEVFLDESRVTRKGRIDLQPDPLAIQPYNPLDVQRLEVYQEDMTSSISDFSNRLRDGQKTTLDDFKESAQAYLAEILKDRGVVIAQCMKEHSLEQSHDAALARRCVLMSILATSVATQLRMRETDCITAGIAAAIHDVALFGEPIGAARQRYIDHPNRSVEMLENSFGVTPQMKVIVSQVHEQCDGSGFPRGLSHHRLHPISRLLNVIDAYLTIIEPHGEHTRGFAPADAVAYLVQQALYGYFDRDCVRGLVSTASVYPVGTHVQLDDGTTATVLRSTGESYLEPVIQLDDAPQSIVDLRFSERIIIAPVDHQKRFCRLSKETLEQVLWTGTA